jgi:hypothetical protein
MLKKFFPPKDSRLFQMGLILFTPGSWTIDEQNLSDALVRHSRGNWGDVCAEDHAANEKALHDGGRIFSIYRDRNGTKFWIITEADRRSTTVLLPEEY